MAGPVLFCVFVCGCRDFEELFLVFFSSKSLVFFALLLHGPQDCKPFCIWDTNSQDWVPCNGFNLGVLEALGRLHLQLQTSKIFYSPKTWKPERCSPVAVLARVETVETLSKNFLQPFCCPNNLDFLVFVGVSGQDNSKIAFLFLASAAKHIPFLSFELCKLACLYLQEVFDFSVSVSAPLYEFLFGGYFLHQLSFFNFFLSSLYLFVCVDLLCQGFPDDLVGFAVR